MSNNVFKLNKNKCYVLFAVGILFSLYWMPALLDEWNLGTKNPYISSLLDIQIQLGSWVFIIALITLFLYFIYTTVLLSIFIIHAIRNKNYGPPILFAVLFLLIIILLASFFIEKVTGLPICPYLQHPIYEPM